MGVVTYISYKFIKLRLGNVIIVEIISLLSSVLIGSLTYGILLVILNIEEVKFVLNIIKMRLNKLLSISV